MVSAWRSEYCTGRATLLRLTGRPLDARIHSAKPVDNHCPIHCTFIVRKYPRSEVSRHHVVATVSRRFAVLDRFQPKSDWVSS